MVTRFYLTASLKPSQHLGKCILQVYPNEFCWWRGQTLAGKTNRCLLNQYDVDVKIILLYHICLSFPLAGSWRGPALWGMQHNSVVKHRFYLTPPCCSGGNDKSKQASKQGLLSGFPTWSRSFWERCVWDSHGNVSAAFFLHELRSTFVLCLKYFTYLIEVLLL